MVARANLPPERTYELLQRVRHRATDSSCGLCGIENLEQALRPLPPVTAGSLADRSAVFRALAMLGDHQPLNPATCAAIAPAVARKSVVQGKLVQGPSDSGGARSMTKKKQK